jgi:hypothetical protein
MRAEQQFRDSLKLATPTKFAAISTVIISRLPDGHPLCANQVVGITYLDISKLRSGGDPLFKQDFVVRVATDGTFISYTATAIAAAAGSPYVRPIAEFERVYGGGGLFYMRPGDKPLVHHFPDVSHLPPIQQAEATALKQRFSVAPLAPNST